MACRSLFGTFSGRRSWRKTGRIPDGMQVSETATHAKELKTKSKQQENKTRASRALYVPLPVVCCIGTLWAESMVGAGC